MSNPYQIQTAGQPTAPAGTQSLNPGQPANYQPDQREVQQPATVAGQLNGLLKSDSPYIQRARTQAMQVANQRGLLNSSFAAGAAEGAAIDRALPIASQDAATFDLRDRTNQAAVNQASQYNATNAQQASMLGAQQAHETGILAKQQAHETAQTNLTFDRQLESQLKTMDAEVAANIRGHYLESMDRIRNNTQVSINEIQKVANITAEDKTKMIDQLISLRDADVKAMQALYASMPQWNQGWAAFPSK